MSFLRTAIVYENILFTQKKKKTHLVKDAAFLHFYLREISKNMLFP